MWTQCWGSIEKATRTSIGLKDVVIPPPLLEPNQTNFPFLELNVAENELINERRKRKHPSHDPIDPDDIKTRAMKRFRAWIKKQISEFIHQAEQIVGFQNMPVSGSSQVKTISQSIDAHFKNNGKKTPKNPKKLVLASIITLFGF